MRREIVCISCPMGCRLTVIWTNEQDIQIEGNGCSRGKTYGKEEILSPRRVVTATCALTGGDGIRIPVKTDAPLSKEHINALLNDIYSRTIAAPVQCGDRIIENISGCGVNLLASASSE